MMVRQSKPSILPLLILLVLFLGALFGIHVTVDSEVGRKIADLCVLITFFTLVTVWMRRG
jgi:hypothetical protein